MKAFETTGLIEANRRIVLDEAPPAGATGRVRIIILMDEAADITEQQWRHAATRNPAFDSLKEPAEDIYSPEDGKPFHDQR